MVRGCISVSGILKSDGFIGLDGFEFWICCNCLHMLLGHGMVFVYNSAVIIFTNVSKLFLKRKKNQIDSNWFECPYKFTLSLPHLTSITKWPRPSRSHAELPAWRPPSSGRRSATRRGSGKRTRSKGPESLRWPPEFWRMLPRSLAPREAAMWRLRCRRLSFRLRNEFVFRFSNQYHEVNL